jgi:hypothetical protein
MRVTVNVKCDGNRIVISSSPLPSPKAAAAAASAVVTQRLQSCDIVLSSFISIVRDNNALAALCDLEIEEFPTVLLISTRHFAILTLSASAADEALRTGTFGQRWQCWTTMEHSKDPSSPDVSASSFALRFTQFCSSVFPPFSSSYSSCPLPLSLALQVDWHDSLVGGLSLRTVFQVICAVHCLCHPRLSRASFGCKCSNILCFKK